MATENPENRTRSALRWLVLMAFLAAPVAGLLFSFFEVLRDGVGGVEGLSGITAVALSPTDTQVYTVSENDSALAVFARSATEAGLVFVEAHLDGQMGVFGLLGASGVTTSPDGRHVYVSAEVDDTLAVFRRDATSDALVFVAAEVQENLVGGVVGLDGASSVAVASDDTQVFVTGRFDDSVAVFSRDPTTDSLVFVEAEFDEMDQANSLAGASSVVVSPDAQHVYVGAHGDDAITQFGRNEGNGGLDYVSEVRNGVGGVTGINGVSALAISPDGLHLYATGTNDDSVALFDRDPVSGELTFQTAYFDGVDGVAGIAGASSVLVNNWGDRVIVAGTDSDALAVFRRTPTTGGLLLLDVIADGMDGADGLQGVLSIALTQDGGDLFAAGHGEDALARVHVAACIGDPDFGDDDGDALCDDLDECLGDDFTGDDDDDGYCDDLDICPGFDDDVDDDMDGEPDGCDLCFGDNSSGDDDGDGICGNLDVCLGDDATGDSDGDMVCDDLDACLGDDASGDADDDGFCADVDCDDADPDNACAIFRDGFESGNTTAWM